MRDDLHNPRTLGRYELGPLLGEGGQGQVYEATLVGPGGFRKPVALKVLHRPSASLRREARIGGLLRHRHLVDVYEIGEADGQWFCALERCAGSLAERLPLPARAVVEVALQVCEALQYAHEELGLIHRDLKPANLLYSDDGLVKVADLGLARAEGFDVRGVGGTVGYMAPEQAMGLEIDARADQYALAVTLLELLTGDVRGVTGTLDLSATLEPESTGATLDLDALEQVQAPVAVDLPELPSTLASVLGRCLEWDPERRFSDMAAVAEALRRAEVEGPGLREALGIRVSEPTSAPASTNLRPSTAPFVGREESVERLVDALAEPGLRTLKGSAGIGKSRLAREAARRWRQATGGQAWVCALGGARSEDRLLLAVGRTLDVPLGRGDHRQQLGHALAARGPLVLVLDDFDGLTAHASALQIWRELAPELRILVTSRQALGCAGEGVQEVGPLDEEAVVALLVERAGQRGVELEDSPSLRALARRLDGLPLAVELAAGRLGILDVDDVLERLGLGLLRSGEEGRHATLEVALDASWTLLDQAERAALARLSVFAGGFSLDAAEQVLDLPTGTLLDRVDALLSRSMLVERGPGRFGLLSTVAEYAGARLDDRVGVEARHGRWFAGLARRAGPRGSRRQQVALRAELDNLVVALRRAVQRGRGSTAVGALEGAWTVLVTTGPFSLGVELAEAVLALDLPPRLAAIAGRCAGHAHRLTGEFARATERLTEALEAARTAGNGVEEARSLRQLGGVHHDRGELPQATERYEAALELAVAHGARAVEADVRGLLGIAFRELGQLSEALESCEAGLALARQVEDKQKQVDMWTNLGIARFLTGDTEGALEGLRAGLGLARALGNQTLEGVVLGNLGAVLLNLGRFDEAREYGEAGLAIHRRVGNRRFEGIELTNLGNLHVHQGRPELGLEFLQEALAINRALGERRAEGYVLASLSELYLDRGDEAEARRYLELAREGHAEVGNPRGHGWCLAKLAELDLDAGDLDAAAPRLERADALFRATPMPPIHASVLALTAELRWRRGDREGARAALAEAEELAPEGRIEAESSLERARRAIDGEGESP